MNPDFDPKTNPELALRGSPELLLGFHLQVEHHYASLIHHAALAEAGLGGRLLYIGELDESGRALMIAANVAGAASVAATASALSQKQAIRDGVADFLVTTLDEALRILKNEIRKREPVAVCVAASPAAVEREMVERGVLPDLLRDRDLADPTLSFGSKPALLVPLDLVKGESLLTWRVDDAPAQWLPRLDALAMSYLAADASTSSEIGLRWLRLAPRYLGKLARNMRILRCSTMAADTIAERMRGAIESGQIAVPVRIAVV